MSKVAFSIPSMMRNAIYDSMYKDPETLASLVGLSPMSAEVSEMEYEASKVRVNKIMPVMPVIELCSQISAQVAEAGISEAFKDSRSQEVSDTVKGTLQELLETVCFAAAVSCVSTLVDFGMVEVPVLEMDIYAE